MNLTAEEYRQLEAIKVLYPWAKWVAKDADGEIGVFEFCPERYGNLFFNGSGEFWTIPEHLLPSLTCDEYGKLNIDETLEGRGCEMETTLSEIVEMLADYREQQTVSKFPTSKECTSFRQGIQAAIALVADYGRGVGG